MFGQVTFLSNDSGLTQKVCTSPADLALFLKKCFVVECCTWTRTWVQECTQLWIYWTPNRIGLPCWQNVCSASPACCKTAIKCALEVCRVAGCCCRKPAGSKEPHWINGHLLEQISQQGKGWVTVEWGREGELDREAARGVDPAAMVFTGFYPLGQHLPLSLLHLALGKSLLQV